MALPELPEFVSVSYRFHERVYDAFSKGGDKAGHAAAWLEPGTINHWRFERMYRLADPLLDTHPNAAWLTVGDGRYGLDAQYLLAHGANALATDISDTLLREACDGGLIPDFRKENAESLSFADESFDYVLCKESYHHFPQPMKALYEMLRVTRRAVIMIEPNDQTLVRGGVATLSRMLKDAVKRLLGKRIDYHNFESSGNYAYAISRREMEKVALGIGLQTVAFKGINDYYLPGVEYEPADPANRLFRKVSGKIARFDLLCRIGINQPGLLGVMFFKQPLTDVLRKDLLKRQFQLVDLPRNPYLKAEFRP